MVNIIDLDKEELDIFLAESKDQLETLEGGLVRLEQEGENPEVVQELFRAAHTLKGSAGMIDHQPMVGLTHALENALDDVRKHMIVVSPQLIDLCLDAADGVWLMLDEIAGHGNQSVNIDALVGQFRQIAQQKELSDNGKNLDVPDVQENPVRSGDNPVVITGQVDQESYAPAARVLQAMMALEAKAEILHAEPSRDDIERAKRVTEFKLELISEFPPEELLADIEDIPDLLNCRVEADGGDPTEAGENESSEDEFEKKHPERLGEYLVERGYLTQEQIEFGLTIQSQSGEERLIGRILVDQGWITRDQLDDALVAMTEDLRSSMQNLEASLDKTKRVRNEDQTVRTSVERLDTLMNEVGELITDRNRLYQLNNVLDKQYRDSEELKVLGETISHLGRTIDQLQNDVMGLRMLPIAKVFKKYPRMVRDIARQEEKKVKLTMDGQDTELDRSVVEAISDPIIHLIRNAVGHGIESPQERKEAGKPETGTVNLSARHERGQIIITVVDDGRGVDIDRVKEKAISKGTLTEMESEVISDEEALYLIFESGVSTAQQVNEISGRGVGMDIVRTNIENLNGSISVENWPGEGMQVEIMLPLNLAVIPTLLVTVGVSVLAIPLAAVTETLRIPVSDVQLVDGEPIIMLRGRPLPLAYLWNTLGFEKDQRERKFENIVAVRLGTSQVGLVVDDFLREEEVMLKSLGILSGKVPGLSGGAILGDGQIALIMDVVNLIKMIINRDNG